ncbi:MAG: hypothetical protein FJ100_07165 [Deltaproteobacteria bacterium]|nr:hypothetical protein [Deltaproteobacteria bacterium]
MSDSLPHSDFDALDRRAWYRSVLPDYGPTWQAAIDMGIDVGELDRRLRWTADERVRALCAMQRDATLMCTDDADPAEH